MEQSTPIQQLNGRDDKQSVDNISYNDILTQMQPPISQQPTIPPMNPQMNHPLKQTPPMNTPVSPMNTPVSPMNTPMNTPMSTPVSRIQYEESHHPMNQYVESNESCMSQQTPSSRLKKKNNNDFHNEMIVLLIVYIIIHTEQFQSFLKSKLPSMFNSETCQINIFGTIMNGILLIILWNVFKKITLKYMKEFN